MTQDEEQRLRSLLDDAAPVPPRSLDGARVRAGASGGRGRSWRGAERPLTLLALAAVVLAVVAALVWSGRSTPAAPEGEPEPSVSSLPCSAADSYRPPRATGTAPQLLPASAFGPSATLESANDTSTPGASMKRADYVVYPSSPTQWQTFAYAYGYATDQMAAQFVDDVVTLQRCAGSTVVRPAGADTVPHSYFVHGRPGGGYADGSWTILVRVGSQVMTFSTQAVNDPPAGGPGDAFLVGVAEAARRQMSGGSPGTVPLPRPTPITGPGPAGFLSPTALGDGWQISGDPHDEGVVAKAIVPGSGCDALELQVVQPGLYVTYRGTQPLGDKEWLLTESVVRLTPASRQKALAQLSRSTSTCPRLATLLHGTTVAGDMVYADRPVGDAGTATMYVLAGDRLIVLTTLPGGATGQDVPLPGDTQWLTSTARAAVAALSRP